MTVSVAGTLIGCHDKTAATPSATRLTGVNDVATTMASPTMTFGRTIDPVCLMAIPADPGQPHAVINGRKYHFCSDECREAFLKEPARYLAKAANPTIVDVPLAMRPALTAPEIWMRGTSDYPVVDGSRNGREEKIDPYRARFGRARPVVAVLCANAGTEVTDFIVPYGVLARSGVAEVLAVSTLSGPVAMPPLRVRAQTTTAEFDDRYPEGADYVVVPFIMDARDPAVTSWVTAQSVKGGTVVSICAGAEVVANAGLLNGRRATAWFGNEEGRVITFPKVKWERNIRYVADGRFVSSAGISASVPTSLALVEAIAGRERAAVVAADLGVADWSSHHDSDAFQPPIGQAYRAPAGPGKDADSVGIPVAPGVDEVALALAADVYARTGATTVHAVGESSDPVTTRNGLVVLPERAIGGTDAVKRILPPLPRTQAARAIDIALRDIAKSYGQEVADGAARCMEYPIIKR